MKKYSWLRGLKKGFVAAAAIGAGLVAGAELLGPMSDGDQISVVGGVGALVMAVRTGWNWWKVNQSLADKKYIR